MEEGTLILYKPICITEVGYSLKFDAETNQWMINNPLFDITTQGTSKEEAVRNLEEALRLTLEKQ